ncbi:MAG: nucleotidyltransferase family protein [Eubacteriales bacterium]|nr:nucleotidyltransferase family protein [Eubacteriales bacterium]
MRICGVIAEYNPFHAGHAYHLAQARQRTGADGVAVVMSGCFVQRGEAAVWDKWVRASHALRGGADVVLELPCAYALQSAEWFAFGGVGVLNALGADCLAFGSESADLDALRRAAALWHAEDGAVQARVRANIRQGMSHPRARAEALAAAGLPVSGAPNDTLGAMYLLWLERLGSAMEAVAVPRAGAAYHAQELTGEYASASAIRAAMARAEQDWRRFVPRAVADESTPTALPLDDLLLHTLRGRRIPDSTGGLDERVWKAARCAPTYAACLEGAKTKAYTMARIKRAVVQAALGMTAADLEMLKRQRPLYARVLGVRREALPVLAELEARARIPLVTRFARFCPQDDALLRLRRVDEAATDLYALTQTQNERRVCGRDYTEKMIII